MTSVENGQQFFGEIAKDAFFFYQKMPLLQKFAKAFPLKILVMVIIRTKVNFFSYCVVKGKRAFPLIQHDLKHGEAWPDHE